MFTFVHNNSPFGRTQMLMNQTFDNEVIINCHYLSSRGNRTPAYGKHGKGRLHPKRGSVLVFRYPKGHRTNSIKGTIKEFGNILPPRDLEDN